VPAYELSQWIEEQSSGRAIWYAKRLSGNDTLANDTNQAGPYVPKDLLFKLFPDLNRPDAVNPDVWFDVYIDSHADHRSIRAVWYNGKVRGAGTRNEARLTNFGGAASALLDPESTGSLALFSFNLSENGKAESCHVWVCDHETEAELIEERIGPVEPGRQVLWASGVLPDPWTSHFGLLSLMQAPSRASCFLSPAEIPSEWLKSFPTGSAIIQKAVTLAPCATLSPDERLLKRRKCEFEVFRSIEQAAFLPRIQAGFGSIDAFLQIAQSVLQSRKSRSGKSLELHAIEILKEEGLPQDVKFSHNPDIEGGKRPDFLFPNREAYTDTSFPRERLRMLAAKTTCKDRWRQILNEADRIPTKHLLTLQEGVSEGQFKEMTDAGVKLVVPNGLHEKFPSSVQPHLTSLETFLAEVRHLTP
jgi:hypothetical protein